MPEENWDKGEHTARMIPVTGLQGGKPKSNEQEIRATSALLAVLSIVREFADALLRPIGAPTGKTAKVEAYAEVPYRLHAQTIRPDGLIHVVGWGGRTWTALVETKTGSNRLLNDQLDRYLEVARTWEYDALITISNEIPPVAGAHPVTSVDPGNITLRHLPWQHVQAVASQQRDHFGVADPEQAWILSELIRYMDHPNSGVADTFTTMGPNWARVRTAAQNGTLTSTTEEVRDVVSQFDALLQFAALQLARSLGVTVELVTSAAERGDPNVRTGALAYGLINRRELAGAIRIPSIDRNIAIAANFLAGRVHFSSDVPAPAGSTLNQTRVKWLLNCLPPTTPNVLRSSPLRRAQGPEADQCPLQTRTTTRRVCSR